MAAQPQGTARLAATHAPGQPAPVLWPVAQAPCAAVTVEEPQYTPAPLPKPHRRIVRGQKAPRLLVLFQCPTCKRLAELDAFDGVPTCHGDPKHGAAFLEAVRLVQ